MTEDKEMTEDKVFKFKSVEDVWNNFSERTINPLAPPLQRSELKYAFFAGASSLMHLCLENTRENEGIIELQKELGKFFEHWDKLLKEKSHG
tara:strand:- start:12 stop:287 length:276 start_codon:yes stop_codon:yes gene_type:complete